MLKPLTMQHASLWLLGEDAAAASLALAESGAFNPEPPGSLQAELADIPGQHFREVYLSARSRLDKILDHYGHRPRVKLPKTPRPPCLEDVEKLNERLGELWIMCFNTVEALRKLEEEKKRIEQLLRMLHVFAALDIDLGALTGEHRFLDVRLGSLPAANLGQLREALSLAGFVIDTFAQDDGTKHCLIAGALGRSQDINSLLHTAGWRTIDVPPELRTHPGSARAALEQRLSEIHSDTVVQRARIDQIGAEHWSLLDTAAAMLAQAAPYAIVVEQALCGHGALTVITGWIPAREAERVQQILDARLAKPHILVLRDPQPEERLRVPSIVIHSTLLRSFARLVRTYGVPRYGEIDPTALFAFSFVLMFGVMFGDIGQGAVIAAGGLLLRGRYAATRITVVAAGLSSMTFGALYGSIFGYEHLIHPLWQSPLTDPLLMLTIAVLWGIGFILVATLIRTYNLYIDRGLTAALLDVGGAAGIVFYLGGAVGLAGLLTGGSFGWLPAAMSTAGFSAVLVHAWHEQKGPLVERTLVSLIETLEAMVSYFTNTLSFMRVGAFSLNHVALAVAVFTLANLMGGVGHWIAVVIGNLFILVLEGAIVAIQVLRLEYYEGFSRFFSGDGREFRPLLLDQEQ